MTEWVDVAHLTAGLLSQVSCTALYCYMLASLSSQEARLVSL